MKKVLTILILGLTILAFSGCGESEELKKGKLEFISNAMNKNFGKLHAQKVAELKYGKEVVAKWIKELEDKGEWINLAKCKQDAIEGSGKDYYGILIKNCGLNIVNEGFKEKSGIANFYSPSDFAFDVYL
ncbi:MAG: hypothetical protein LBG67_03245 [Campylobacteraceae bacterium]|jgi:ABC-type Fe3+-citrate transport system substrate-binding protein|nr:hypothetical protein [Campylobacteraceae bacterium]